MEEIWKPYREFDGLIMVSNKGNIKRLETITISGKGMKIMPERILTPKLNSNASNLPFVNVSIDKKVRKLSVNKLVYETFHNTILDKKFVVINKDNNVFNAALDNLALMTMRDFNLHRSGVQDTPVGVIADYSRKKEIISYHAQIVFAGKPLVLHRSKSKEECAKVYQLAKSMINEYEKLKNSIINNTYIPNKLINKQSKMIRDEKVDKDQN